MPDPDLDRIAEQLRIRRAELERDMDDTDRNINSRELLERIEGLRKRMERLGRADSTVETEASAKPLPAVPL